MDTTAALAAMQGTADGHGKGLTTYPCPSPDEEAPPESEEQQEQRETHEACLALEQTGEAARYLESVSTSESVGVVPYVIWYATGESAVAQTVTSIDPSTAICGGPDLTLHVYGLGFTAASVIVFNHGEEPTTFVSATELTTGVKPSLVAAPVVVPVSVVGAPTAQDFTFDPPA